jgi:hypothetical protein
MLATQDLAHLAPTAACVSAGLPSAGELALLAAKAATATSMGFADYAARAAVALRAAGRDDLASAARDAPLGPEGALQQANGPTRAAAASAAARRVKAHGAVRQLPAAWWRVFPAYRRAHRGQGAG